MQEEEEAEEEGVLMELFEVMFLLGFLLIVGLTMLKVLNLLYGGAIYSWQVATFTWVLSLFGFGIELITFLNKYDVGVLRSIFKLTIPLMMVVTGLFTIEIIIALANKGMEVAENRYSPEPAEQYYSRYR